jgi:hypothetical protein
MLAFPDVFYFLAHKLSRLGAGRFAFPGIFSRSFDCLLFRHMISAKRVAIFSPFRLINRSL